MKTFYLTVYAKSGENLLDEPFEANHDQEAKEIGQEKLKQHQYEETTHRCVAPDGRLVLFHR
ncbi:YhzD family protein [Alkalibacillus aidingensis]|uniref:YhzD family protein n=1 Tax=Alkalibacillus aidingensis TaxID=2747607 RepID=UPI0016612735|nr:YhzD family protein [Alkalibacillus aidingensis]